MGAAKETADKKVLQNLVPLNKLSSIHFKEVTKNATIEELSSGKYLFHQGKRDDHTYYLLSGELILIDGKKVIGKIKGGSAEARHPISPEQPRKLSARAHTNITVIRLETSLLDVLLDWDQSAQYEVTEIQSEDDEDWMTKMLKSELFAHLPAQNIQKMIMRMKEVRFAAGESVIRQNDDGDCYYIIKEGHCVVSRQVAKDSKPVLIAELRDGDGFGEEALLSDSRRNASVTMISQGSLMRLTKEDFQELLENVLVTKVNFMEAALLVKEGARWLDIQLPPEHGELTIPNATYIPLPQLRESRDKLDVNETYVVFCRDGRRSASAVFILGQHGFDALLLDGGLKAIPRKEMDALQLALNKTVRGADVINFNPVQESKPTAHRDPPVLKEKSPPPQEEKEKTGSSLTREAAENLKNFARDTKSQESRVLDGKANQAQLHSLKTELDKVRAVVDQQDREIAQIALEKEKLIKQMRLISSKDKSQDKKDDEIEALHKQLEEMQYEHDREHKEMEKQVEALQRAADRSETLRAELKEMQGELTEQRRTRDKTTLEVERESQKTVEAEQTAQLLQQQISKLQQELKSRENETAGLQTELQRVKEQQSSTQQNALSQLHALKDDLSRVRAESRDFQEQLTQVLAEKQSLGLDKQESDESRAALIEQQAAKAREARDLITRLEAENKAHREELETQRTLMEQVTRASQSDTGDAPEKQEFLDTVQKLQAKIRTLEKQGGDLHELLAANERNVEKLKEQKSKIDFDWQASEKARTGLAEQVERERERTNEKNKKLEAQLDLERSQSKEILDKAQSSLKDREQQIDKSQQELKALKQERDQFERQLTDSQQKTRTQEDGFNNENLKLKKSLEKYEVRIEELEKQVGALETERKNLADVKQALVKEKQAVQTEWSEKYEQQVADVRAAKYRNDQLETEVNILKTDFEQSRKRITELEQERGHLLGQLQQSERTQLDSATQGDEYKSVLRDMGLLELEYKKDQSSAKSRIEDLNKTISELRDDIRKYRELQLILEEKNHEMEVDLSSSTDYRKKLEDSENEIAKLKRQLNQTQVELDKHKNKKGAVGASPAAAELQKELTSLKDDLFDLQRRHRELEDEKITVALELEQAKKRVVTEGLSSHEQTEKLKDLTRYKAKTDKDLENLKTELVLAKSTVADTESQLKAAQRLMRESEIKIQQINNELKIAQNASAQTTMFKEKLEEIKRETKDQLKHYQYEYEAMVQKTRDENRVLRQEVEHLRQQPQRAAASSFTPVASRVSPPPTSSVMRLDLPPDTGEVEPVILTEIADMGRFSSPLQGLSDSSTFTAHELGAGRSKTSTRSVRRSIIADDEDPFETPKRVREPYYLSRAVAFIVVLAVLGGLAYWYFDIYPRIKREEQRQLQAAKKKIEAARRAPAPIVEPEEPIVNEPRKPVSKPKPVVPEEKPLAAKSLRTFTDKLQDNSQGPNMVELDNASFQMGNKSGILDENETPRHAVKLKKYSISKYEVTYEDYIKFTKATNRRVPDDKEWGQGRRPVINVSWYESVAYTKWLSEQTGRIYRLPTEAEWEHAARAGTMTEYFWGGDVGKAKANCFDCGSKWDSLQTAPVGSFSANNFGLHDMNGNAMEWVLDCYHPNYRGAPRDGSAWVSDECKTRVVRGGSYKSPADNIRSYAREQVAPETTNAQIGFRVVREH